jgi:hypothetical protein
LPLVAVVTILQVRGECRAEAFTRGDVNQSGRIDITDAVLILEKLFRGGQGVSCDDSADADDDGALTVSDPIWLLGGLFRGGPSPAAPFPGCGDDPTEDALSCDAFEACLFAFEYYGKELSGDAVIFVLDISSPLGTHGDFSKFKGEIQGVVESMPDGVRFAMVFFAAFLIRFPSTDQPAVASDETRASAAALLRQISSGSGTCGDKALLRSVDFARLTGARRNLILYASNGGGTCMGLDEAVYLDRSLEEVTLANSGLARIHTFGILLSNEVERDFLVRLAERNGGTFTVVSEETR